MILRNRLSLVGLGVLIFIIATPLLVLYARGFKIDWHTWKITKTGAIVVKSEPTKANVYLNDQKQSSLTPANLRFILPGDYVIRVEKDGYQSWTKRLSVRTQFVTWANANRDFIALFLAQPQTQQTFDAKITNVSADGKQIALVNQKNALQIINTDTSNISSFDLGNLPAISFPGDFNWIKGTSVFQNLKNVLAKNPQAADQMLKATKISVNGSQVVFSLNNNLYSLNETGTTALIDKSVSAFSLSDGVWYIQNQQLKHFDFNKQPSVISVNPLPSFASAQVIRTAGQIYLILDQSLYIVNGNLQKIYSPATFAKFDDKSDNLVYGNANEIYIYSPVSNQSELILRSQTPISNATLNTETGYIFFQNEGKIKAIEFDGRDHRNVFSLTDALDQFTLSTDGTKLYVISKSQVKEYLIR